METLRKITERTHRLMQVVIALLLFFPIVFDALAKLSGDKLSIDQLYGSNVTLLWGVMIGAFLLSYLYIELKKNKVSIPAAISLNILVFVEVASFAIVLMTLGLVTKAASESGVWFHMYLFASGVGLLAFIPIIIFLILAIDFIYSTYALLYISLRKEIKRR